jgi:hypothetical protein
MADILIFKELEGGKSLPEAVFREARYQLRLELVELQQTTRPHGRFGSKIPSSIGRPCV